MARNRFGEVFALDDDLDVTYDEKADVYSFGILMYEAMGSLDTYLLLSLSYATQETYIYRYSRYKKIDT